MGFFTLKPDSLLYKHHLNEDFIKELKKVEGMPVEQEFVDKLIKLGIAWEKYSSVDDPRERYNKYHYEQ